jgi:hypothetical protein
MQGAVAYDDKLGPIGANGFSLVAQLRHLLTAEPSAKVPDKDKHRSLTSPRIEQFVFAAVDVNYSSVRRLLGNTIHHLPQR